MARRKQQNVTVGFVALGCPKNVVDSERMLAQIAQAGFLVTGDVSQVDVVVINTCGFIEPAKLESMEAVTQAVADKRAGRIGKVIVTGCLSQRMGAELLDEAQGIDAVVGLEHRDRIVEIIRRTLSGRRSSVYRDALSDRVTDDRVRLRIGPSHWAYLRISEGCDHRCSFCTIPAIRGSFRSKPAEMIRAEAVELISSGAVEVNLIGQDTTAYGRDRKVKDGLARLLGELEGLADLTWLRLLYAYPTGITKRLIGTMAESKKVVRYLDIPIQHASDTILQAMRRPDTQAGLRKMIEQLRIAMSDIVLRTTLIVGFPGETDAQFTELLDFVRWARFDALGAFTYFAEPGTPAAEFPNQVPDEIKEQRLETLMLAQQEIAFAKNAARVGSRLMCLIDAIDEEGTGYGRFYGQAPEIDSLCLVTDCAATPGQYVEVEVVGTQDYDLVVAQI